FEPFLRVRRGDVRLQVFAGQRDAQVGGRRPGAVIPGRPVLVRRPDAVQRLDVGEVVGVNPGLGADVLVINAGGGVGVAVKHAQDVADFVEHARIQVVGPAGQAELERAVDDDVAGPGRAGPLELRVGDQGVPTDRGGGDADVAEPA